MTEKEPRDCKLTLYIETPWFMIPKKLKRRVMERKPEEMGTTTGHIFFGITDEKGVENTYGLHSASGVLGPDKVAPEDALIGMKDLGKTVKGLVKDETGEPYDEFISYKVTRAQYDKVRDFAENAIKNPPRYNVFTYNCTNFSYQALRQAKIALPPQMPVLTPMLASVGVRIFERVAKIKDSMANAAVKAVSWFSSESHSVGEAIKGWGSHMAASGVKTFTTAREEGKKLGMQTMKAMKMVKRMAHADR